MRMSQPQALASATLPSVLSFPGLLKPGARFRCPELLRPFHVAQTGGFAFEAAEVVELGAANFGRAQQVDFVYHFGMDGENALHALTKTDLAHGEAGLRSTVALDDHAFEGLQTLLIAFLDLHVHAHGVAGAKFWEVGAPGFSQQLFNNQV